LGETLECIENKEEKLVGFEAVRLPGDEPFAAKKLLPVLGR
jgi:hypothetical protein